MGGYVAGIFGMNLHNHVEDEPNYFRAVVAITSATLGLIFILSVVFLRLKGIFHM